MTSTGAPEEPAVHPRRRRGYFLPGGIALAALLLIGGVVGAGDLSHPAPRTLAGSDMASEIALAFQSARGTPAPPSVHCPASEPVRRGQRFVCTLEVPGSTSRRVDVVEIDARGHLHWSLAAG